MKILHRVFFLLYFLVAISCCTASRQHKSTINHLSRHGNASIPTALGCHKSAITRYPSKIKRKEESLIASPGHSLSSITNLRGGGLGSSSINHFFKAHPYAAAFSVCALKASAADTIAQKIENSNKKMEKPVFQFKRNFAFICYGGLYQGCFQEYLYNHVFTQVFGLDNRPMTAFKKVSFDAVIISPFLCLPIAYIIKAIVFKQALAKGLQRYVYDVTNNGLLTKKTLFWAPINLFTFTVVPEHMRITFVACFSFFWLILMSSIAGKGR